MMSTIAQTAKIFPNVYFGKNVVVEDYCIIGIPFKGQKNEVTLIGDNAIIRSHTVIYAGNKIGNCFHTGNKTNIRELNVIGNNVSIGTLSVIEHHVVIEDNVRVHSQAFIPEFTILKNNCWIGPNVVFTNAKYPLSPNVKNELKGAIVNEFAKIGANSTILPNIVIGKNALVGAGSVVVDDVSDGVVVVGNPSRVLRQVHY